MNDDANVPGSPGTPRRDREYTAASHARHRSAVGTRRLVFFTFAAVWGFSVGVAGFVAAMSAAGDPVVPRSGALIGLIPALIVAVAGAFIVAAAYRESKRRSQR